MIHFNRDQRVDVDPDYWSCIPSLLLLIAPPRHRYEQVLYVTPSGYHRGYYHPPVTPTSCTYGAYSSSSSSSYSYLFPHTVGDSLGVTVHTSANDYSPPPGAHTRREHLCIIPCECFTWALYGGRALTVFHYRQAFVTCNRPAQACTGMREHTCHPTDLTRVSCEPASNNTPQACNDIRDAHVQ